MSTVLARINDWRIDMVRGEQQVNDQIALRWYNKGLQIFQKELLAYASGQLNNQTRYSNIEEKKSEYTLPLGINNVPDFYSILNLRVAYNSDDKGNPLYRECEAINITDYNFVSRNNSYETGTQFGDPNLMNRVSELTPRYTFIDKNTIKIYPTPTKNVRNGLSLSYNYIEKKVELNTEEDSLNLPWYFFDAIEDYMSYKLILSENPELAAPYYETFKETIHRNIYGLDRDVRESEEEFANLSRFYKN